MTEKDLAEDYRMVLHEAKSMGCNKIKALHNIPLKNMEMIVQALEEVQQYREIGTPEECREAVEKQTDEKPTAVLGIFGGTEYECKNCGSDVCYGDEYCRWCGQKLDWSDEE